MRERREELRMTLGTFWKYFGAQHRDTLSWNLLPLFLAGVRGEGLCSAGLTRDLWPLARELYLLLGCWVTSWLKTKGTVAVTELSDTVFPQPAVLPRFYMV